MRISKPEPGVVHEIALNMRAEDFAEFSAVTFCDTREHLADVMEKFYGPRDDVHIGYDGDTPVCMGCTALLRPGVIALAFFATDDFPKIGMKITRYIRQRLFPRLREAGVHRIEAVSMQNHRHAQQWLRALGLSPETGPLRGYGKNGETYIQFSWVADACPAGA